MFADLQTINGVGEISTKGIVADIDLVLNSPGDLRRRFTVENQPGDRVQIDVDLSSGQAPVMGVGYAGEGTLEISNGVTIESPDGVLAIGEASTASALVTGAGSAWRVQRNLTVGDAGSASLDIEQGAEVSARSLDVRGTDSLLRVSGEGSRLHVDSLLIIGTFDSRGTLIVEDGASLQTEFLNNRASLGLDRPERLQLLEVRGEGTRVDAGFSLSASGWSETRILEGAQLHVEFLDVSGQLSETLVAVSGVGSLLRIERQVGLRALGSGSLVLLSIESGGTVAAEGVLPAIFGGESIRMATGGMLALQGGFDDETLSLIEFWSEGEWRPFDEAIPGVDFDLTMPESGEFAGYTVLTVGAVVPEPAATTLAACFLVGVALCGPPFRTRMGRLLRDAPAVGEGS